MAERGAKGEGSLYEYRDGFRAYITVKGKRKYFYFPNVTKQDAARLLRDRLNQRDSGLLPKGKDMPLSTWMRHWLKTANLKPNVAATYSHNIERYIAPTIGHIRLTALEPEDLEQLYFELAEGKHSRKTWDRTDPKNPVQIRKRLAGRSIRNVHANIRAALGVAVKRGHAGRNVALAVTLPPLRTVEMETLSERDSRLILSSVRGHHHEARWYLALVFGIRPAEVLGIEWTAIDLDARTIHIRQQLQRVKGVGMAIIHSPKTDAGNRIIPIPDSLVEMLKATRQMQMDNRIRFGETYIEWEHEGDPTSLVFTQANGAPIDIKVDTRAWASVLEAAGLPYSRRYIGRHTAASIMVNMGMDIAVVSSILGHKKTSFTYDTYVHPLQSAKRSAADALGDLYR